MAAIGAQSGAFAGRCAYAATRVRASAAFRVPAIVPAAVSATATSAAPRAARFASRATPRGSRVALRATSEDAIYRTMSENQEVSVIAVVGTSLVADAVSRHKTAPTATAALGRTMLAATLLGTFKGDDETTQITFKGDGPIGQIIAISDNTGMVKGLVGNPAADPPLRPDGKLNVGGAVGRGLLTVSRAHPEWKAPFNGTVQITTGEIAEDIAVYLQESEQVNSAIAVGVSLDRSLEIRRRAGTWCRCFPSRRMRPSPRWRRPSRTFPPPRT